MASDTEDRTEIEWNDLLSEENRARVADGLDTTVPIPPRWKVKSNHRVAAVLVPLVMAAEGPSVLLTVRSNTLSRHRNQVSFPGGLMDTTDIDSTDTALREAEEELGIDRAAVDVWGQLPALPDRMDSTVITPVLASLGNLDVNSLKLNTSEVHSVFSLPLCHVASRHNQRYTQYKLAQFRSPVFLGGPRRVWGLSAMILDLVLLRLLPKAYNYKPITFFLWQ